MIEGYVSVTPEGYPDFCTDEELAWRRVEMLTDKHRDLLKADGWRVAKVREVGANECTSCGGTGKWHFKVLEGPNKGHEFDAPCGDCGGSGVREVEE